LLSRAKAAASVTAASAVVASATTAAASVLPVAHPLPYQSAQADHIGMDVLPTLSPGADDGQTREGGTAMETFEREQDAVIALDQLRAPHAASQTESTHLSGRPPTPAHGTSVPTRDHSVSRDKTPVTSVSRGSAHFVMFGAPTATATSQASRQAPPAAAAALMQARPPHTDTTRDILEALPDISIAGGDSQMATEDNIVTPTERDVSTLLTSAQVSSVTSRTMVVRPCDNLSVPGHGLQVPNGECPSPWGGILVPPTQAASCAVVMDNLRLRTASLSQTAGRPTTTAERPRFTPFGAATRALKRSASLSSETPSPQAVGELTSGLGIGRIRVAVEEFNALQRHPDQPLATNIPPRSDLPELGHETLDAFVPVATESQPTQLSMGVQVFPTAHLPEQSASRKRRNTGAGKETAPRALPTADGDFVPAPVSGSTRNVTWSRSANVPAASRQFRLQDTGARPTIHHDLTSCTTPYHLTSTMRRAQDKRILEHGVSGLRSGIDVDWRRLLQAMAMPDYTPEEVCCLRTSFSVAGAARSSTLPPGFQCSCGMFSLTTERMPLLCRLERVSKSC